ncbi:Fibronectin type III domain protein [Akanthomyces lecanii RCEF 1005]|uniref:Fibronectin type III domain protein n=1 Tax=Akanthomyces lecanii RCEF 1005 TaxID=1081108 RepID=A0A168KVX6_CORDF|nr:Fibronectin type III domain protein [Akanthomyces lecanii RCEF 1005]
MKTVILGTMMVVADTASSDVRLGKRIFGATPKPVGGGGTSYFSQALYFEHDGKKYHPRKENCTVDKDDATCQHCLVGGGGLYSATTVLIVGDSITHGQEGDFTWRYRISEWFKNYGPDTKPEFVGPYTGTQERDKPKGPQPPRLSSDLPPNTSPKFQSNHFAVWGRQIAQDILHPNAYGEYLTAQSFSRTLYSDFSVGKGQLQLPRSYLPRSLPVPSNIKAVPEPMGVKVTCDEVYQSNSYDVRVRIAGSSDWTESRAGTNRFDQTFTGKNIKWKFQIRSSYGEPAQGGAKGAWSGIHALAAHRHSHLVVRSQPHGLLGRRGQGPGDRFGVIVWDRDTPGAFINTHGARESPFTLDGLHSGHRYDIWVETWGGPGVGGLPSGGNPVVIGGGSPLTPTGLKAVTVDPTTVHLTWNAAKNAAVYKIYTNPDETVQKTGSKPSKDGKLARGDTNWGETFLFPGAWHFEFCVSAINGQKESSRVCATAPKADGF